MYITAAICGFFSEKSNDNITVNVATTQNNIIKTITNFFVNGLSL